jgi:hypothetical protein
MGVTPVTDSGDRSGRVFPFLVLCLELVLLLAVVYLFDIEAPRHFLPVLGLACGGFVLHSWLPARYRLGFFAVLSLVGVVLFLGWPRSAYVLGIGAGLITLCHLPVRLAIRVLLLVVAGLVLAMWRVEEPAPFWPVLGSLFMFRLIVYLYDLRHERSRPPLAWTLAYFCPLPNVCFILFPVLDFKTFRETYQTDDAYRTYQTGVAWMVRGLSHLLLYRLIKYYFLPAPHHIRDLPHLLLFLATNYALYLRISGQFHLITGMLRLFGFGLPRTHDNYFLANSFSDIWRRINIYWKDFLAKVFFLPAFYTLRPLGTRPALALAAGWVFLCTWLLHAYQLFWLLGDLSLTATDALLWLTTGLLVAANLQVNLSATIHRSPLASAFSWGGAIRHSFQVLSMFLLISLFWGLWTVPALLTAGSFATLRDVMSIAGVLWLLATALGIVTIGVLVQRVRAELIRQGVLPRNVSFRLSAGIQAATLALLLLAGIPQVSALMGPQTASILATLRLDRSTVVEARGEVQGYYEEIVEAPVQASPFLGALIGKRDTSSRTTETPYLAMTREVDDLLGRELIPGWSGVFAGKRLTVNQLGLRDRDGISPKKPAGTCRIALVGSSIVMGYGVADDEVFGRLLEDQLNAARGNAGPPYELLNFGVGLCYAIQRRVLLDRKVLAFEPDAVYYFAHQDELLGPPKHLAGLVFRGRALPYSCLTEVVRKAGVSRDLSYATIEVQLTRFGPEIVLGLYHDFVEHCRKRGILPVWIYVPMPGIVDVPVQSADVVRLAEQAGFVVLNLADWSAGYHPVDVKLNAADHHANALGHRLLAERLMAVLRQRPELLPAFARLRGRGPE